MWGCGVQLAQLGSSEQQPDGSVDSGPSQELLQKTWCGGSTWMMNPGDLKSKLSPPLEFGHLCRIEGHILYINIHQICINICQRLCAPESHENFNDNQICAQSSPKSSFCRSLLHESSPIYSKILRIPKRSQEAYEILSGPRSRHSLEVWRWTAPLHSTGRSFRRGRQVHSLDEITCIGWDHWLFWKDGNMKILQKWKTI